MRVTVVGGGNIGTQFAVHCAEKNHEVTMFTSSIEGFSKKLKIVDENNVITHEGTLKTVTTDEKVAFSDTELIFITYPAFMMDKIAATIEPYVYEGLKIAVIPGTGGCECAFKKCIEKGAIFIGMQRVPSVARLVKKGETVQAVGYRGTLNIATIPSKYSTECASMIEGIFDIKCIGLPNYLNVALTPSNPILHTTRLCNIFEDYEDGKVYDSLPLFYEGWNDETSNLLFNCDTELQNICKSIDGFDLSHVISLKIHYESPTSQALTNKIKSIKGFKNLTTPSKMVDGKYIPDLNSRYFTADFNYGLIILIQIAKLFGVETPNMQKVWDWYDKIKVFDLKFSFSNYDINTKQDFLKFYGA